MTVKLGSNIASLGAQRRLTENISSASTALERLSSGLRINRASDDAAGLAIASGLNADRRIMSQGIRNLNDGLSLLNIAEGALKQLSDITIRQKELAEQAANGVYTFKQRKALASEANALTDEFNRIIGSTKFNGVSIFDGSTSQLNLQTGSSNLQLSIGSALNRVVGSGTYAAATSVVVNGTQLPGDVGMADFNNDGKLDLVSGGISLGSYVLIGNGDATFSTGQSLGFSELNVNIVDLNGDGKLDVVGGSGTNVYVNLGVGNGTFNTVVSYAVSATIINTTVGDLNGDGKLDVVADFSTAGQLNILLGNGDGTLLASSQTISAGSSPWGVKLADFNNDNALDLIVANNASGAAGGVTIFMGNGNGSFKSGFALSLGSAQAGVAIEDFNGDGYADFAVEGTNSANVFLGNGDGSFKSQIVVNNGISSPRTIGTADLNNDGIPDLFAADNSGNNAVVMLGNGDGTFLASTSYAVGNQPRMSVAGDLNGDGILDLTTANSGAADHSISILLGNSTVTVSEARLNLYSQSSARSALSIIDSTLTRVTQELGVVGAHQSRIALAINSLSATVVEYAAAQGRIADADVAQESAELVRRQILVKTGLAVISQANLEHEIVLRLLQ